MENINYNVTVSYKSTWSRDLLSARLSVSAIDAHQAVKKIKDCVAASAGVKKYSVKLVDIVKTK